MIRMANSKTQQNTATDATGKSHLPFELSHLQRALRRFRKTRPVYTERRKQLVVESMEPRYMLSGDALIVPPAAEDNDDNQAVIAMSDAVLTEQLVSKPISTTSTSKGKQSDTELHNVSELVFVDPTVENYETLISKALVNRFGSTEPAGVEVVVLDSSTDGIKQVGGWLKQYEDLNAVHLIAHGDDGVLRLGSSALSQETLDEYRSSLTLWGMSLSDSADLLLYGCETGADNSFINTLSEITGADVAASADAVGKKRLEPGTAQRNH